MTYLIAAGVIVLLSLGLVALLYRGKAKAEQHHAEQQQQRADAAVSINNNRQQLDTALESLHETQREETIHANDPKHLAERSDFDNDWSDDAGLHSTGTDAVHATSAAAADSSGSASDQVGRADLSE